MHLPRRTGSWCKGVQGWSLSLPVTQQQEALLLPRRVPQGGTVSSCAWCGRTLRAVPVHSTVGSDSLLEAAGLARALLLTSGLGHGVSSQLSLLLLEVLSLFFSFEWDVHLKGRGARRGLSHGVCGGQPRWHTRVSAPFLHGWLEVTAPTPSSTPGR